MCKSPPPPPNMAIQVFKIEVMHLRSTYKSHPLTRVQQYSTSKHSYVNMHWNNHSNLMPVPIPTHIHTIPYLIEHFFLPEEHEHWHCIHLTHGDCTLKKQDSWNRSVSSMVAVISISTHPCLKSNRWAIIIIH